MRRKSLFETISTLSRSEHPIAWCCRLIRDDKLQLERFHLLKWRKPRGGGNECQLYRQDYALATAQNHRSLRDATDVERQQKISDPTQLSCQKFPKNLTKSVCKFTKTCGGRLSDQNPSKEQLATQFMIFFNQFCTLIWNRSRSGHENLQLQKHFVNLQKQNYKN